MTRSQEDQEKPAKVWQIVALSEKLDSLADLIKAQSGTYPTKTEVELKFEKRDNEIKNIKRTLANYTRIVWIVVSAVVPTIALSVWQLIINSARLPS